jgi:hypothetical protein
MWTSLLGGNPLLTLVVVALSIGTFFATSQMLRCPSSAWRRRLAVCLWVALILVYACTSR